MEKELQWVHKDLDDKEQEEQLVAREGREALEALKVDHSIEIDRIKEEHRQEIQNLKDENQA